MAEFQKIFSQEPKTYGLTQAELRDSDPQTAKGVVIGNHQYGSCVVRINSPIALEIHIQLESIEMAMQPDSNKSSGHSNLGKRVFATTSWSTVLEAADLESKGVENALSELCQQYWYPLYAFARRKGFNRAEAEDLTQSFFADLLEKKRLKHAEPSRGRFRSFLLASLNNFISNHWRAEGALKRGGEMKGLSIDYENADHRYREQAGSDLSPEKVFQKNWALSILGQTLEAVEQQYEESGKRELFNRLKCFLTGDDEISYSELSKSSGMRPGALKVAVHRLRQRYGQQLRLQIAKTVEDPSDVDQELSALFQALQ